MVGQCEFQFASQIDAERDNEGRPITYTAFERFTNPRGLPLHKYGRGPFVRLKVAALPTVPGVYAITQGAAVVYIGIAVNLAERWGRRGYSVIDPRNCYRGGQTTNCHVNLLLGGELMSGNDVALWVHEHATPRPLEVALLGSERPPWNVQGV